MPICAVVTNTNLHEANEIFSSLDKTSYKKLKKIYLAPLSDSQSDVKGVNNYVSDVISFLNLKKAINKFCQPNAIIFVANNKVQALSLEHLSSLYQTNYVYMTYSKRKEKKEKIAKI